MVLRHMHADRVTVVIVHRNRPTVCRATVDGFRAQGAVDIRVVDNGSPAAALRMLAPVAEVGCLLALGRNLGFGPAANVAIRHWLQRGRGEWVVIAPDDAQPAPGCLERLIDVAGSRPAIGVASAEFGPGHEYAPTVDRVLGPYNRPVPRGTGWQPADFGHGTLLALRRPCVEAVGLFDEAFFAYCEEADIAIRARAAGWEAGFVWDAVVANRLPSSTTTALYLQLRNTLRLVRKHSGPGAARTRLAMALASRLGSRVSGRRALHRAQARAIADFRAGRFGPPPRAMMEELSHPE